MEIAHAEGMRIITVDRKTLREDIVLSHIASDNVAGGRMAGEFIARRLRGKGKILELEGIPGTSAAYDRGKGFNEVINKHPGLEVAVREVADFGRNRAKEVTTQILKRKVSFDAIFAHNDPMALGAIDAFAAAGAVSPPVIVGFDATPEALEAVRQKKLAATIAQKPERMGWLAVQSAVRSFSGEKLPKVAFVELKLIDFGKLRRLTNPEPLFLPDTGHGQGAGATAGAGAGRGRGNPCWFSRARNRNFISSWAS